MYARDIIGEWGRIAVKNIHLPIHQALQVSAQGLHRKELDAKTRQPIQIDVVIITKIITRMNKTILFAIDLQTEEIIVSESQKGSNKVNSIERIPRSTNESLYNAVVTLSSITNAPNFEVSVFKAMDKVCQLIYNKHIESR